MEVFKFGVYMFFPVLIMYKFGDPEWCVTGSWPAGPQRQHGMWWDVADQGRYETYVKPVRPAPPSPHLTEGGLGGQEGEC